MNEMQCPGKEVLSQYCDMRQEIKEILEEIDRLERQEKNEVHGAVKGSSSEFPYTPQTFHISGYDEYTKSCMGEIRKREVILRERNQRLLQLQTEVEQWIDSIEESRIRRIFQMRYLQNMSWVRIAGQMGESESSIKMTHKRFLEKK